MIATATIRGGALTLVTATGLVFLSHAGPASAAEQKLHFKLVTHGPVGGPGKLPEVAGHTVTAGEYFGVDAKRLTHSMKRKRFLWGAEILAVKLEDDEQIARAFVHVSDEIRKWSRSNRIRTLTLDLTVWERVGPHIRWAEILS